MMFSVKDKCQIEYEVSKSKFIGILIPITDESEVVSHLKELQIIYPGANHYCYGYVLGEHHDVQKASDDGEPQKTAGIPILDVIKKKNLTNVLLVVIRYFGGIKLGAGGLIRSYAKAATLVIDEAVFTTKQPYLRMSFEIDYPYTGDVEKIIRDKTRLIEAQYLSKVKYDFIIKKEAFNEIDQELFSRSKFSIHPQIEEEFSLYE